jgi:hypothetical protein
MFDQLQLPYPAPSGNQTNAPFTVYAMYTCEAVLDAQCPTGRNFRIEISRGAFLGDPTPGDWQFEHWGAVHQVASTRLAANAVTPIVSFDAGGRCVSLVDGADCGL